MFNQENAVEQMVLDSLCGSVSDDMVAEKRAQYGGQIKGWRFGLMGTFLITVGSATAVAGNHLSRMSP
jgi:hypothetical protein